MGKKKERKEKKQKGFSSRSSSSSRPGLEQTASQVDPTGSTVVGHDDESGDLVGKYGVQALATDLEALPLGPNPHHGDSALKYAIRYSPPRSESKHLVERPSSSDIGHSD